MGDKTGGLTLVISAIVLMAGCDRLPMPIGGVVAWDEATPESLGFSAVQLDTLRARLADKGTKALLIVRHNQIAYEWYAPFHSRWRKEGTASMAKALVGGMSLAIAIDDGLIKLDAPAAAYIPAWDGDPARSAITIRHLATHTSGIEHRDEGDQVGWKRVFWGRQRGAFEAVLKEAPITFTPGTRFMYSGPAFAALGYSVTASLKDSPYSDIEAALEHRIMEPLGVPRSAWTISYGRSFRADGMRLHATWSGAFYSARAAARVGQLMLQKGRWQGRQLIDSTLVEIVLSPNAILPSPSEGRSHPAPAICWWVNSNGAWPSLPLESFAAVGAGGQVLLVVPSLDLVMVRFGDSLGDAHWGPTLWDALENEMFRPLTMTMVAAGSPFTDASLYGGRRGFEPALDAVPGVGSEPDENTVTPIRR
jgi:CubicO group peptidase (beta-lactamase class C family)